MAIRQIILEGDPILTKKCRPVEKFDKRLSELLDDMAETMYNGNGVGLAGPQVGILRRVIVVDTGDGLIQLINPQIVESSGEQREQEGCLSCPGRSGVTLRPMIVKVTGLNKEGNPVEYFGRGLKARAFCHEIDHLDGILFMSRVVAGEKGLIL